MRSWCSSTAALTASLAPPSEMRTQIFVDTVPCYFSGSLFCKKRIAEVGISVVLSVALSIYLSIYLSTCLPLSILLLPWLACSIITYLPIYAAIRLHIRYLSASHAYASIHPSIHPSIQLHSTLDVVSSPDSALGACKSTSYCEKVRAPWLHLQTRCRTSFR